MVERRYYRVAGLSFSLCADTGQLTLLTNYAPFLIPESQASEPVFDLKVGSFPQPADATHLFTDAPEDIMPRIEVYRVPSTGEWLFRMAPLRVAEECASMLISPDFRQATLFIAQRAHTRFAIDNAAMLLFALSSAPLSTLQLHAAAVVRNECAYIFLGTSGTGKSTHARLWQEAFPDAWLLNDDNPVLRILPDGEVQVYGSPWSGKTPCYKPLSAPIRGIVQLRQAPVNKIQRLPLPEAYAYLLSSSSGLKTQPEMMDALYNTMVRVLDAVPVYILDCLPDTDAARLCHDTINS